MEIGILPVPSPLLKTGVASAVPFSKAPVPPPVPSPVPVCELPAAVHRIQSRPRGSSEHVGSLFIVGRRPAIFPG